MALFDFLKKKERDLPLPPPPLPPQRVQGDFEQIRAPQELREWAPPAMEEHHDDLPPLPPLPPLPELHDDSHEDMRLLPAPAEEKEVVFDRTVLAPRSDMQKAPARTMVTTPAKTFVSVNDYKQILNETNMVRSRLMSADNFVKKLQDLKVDEERALDRWRTQLEDVEKKLAYVDQLIEKAQR